MRVLSVMSARAIALFDIGELNPGGRVFLPNVISELVERFQFQNFPKTPEQFDEKQGIEFLDGHWNGVNVEKFTIYFNGILVQTQSSTADSQRIIDEGLRWGSEHLGLHYEPTMLKRWRFLNAFSFTTEVPILEAHSAVSNLANGVSEAMAHLIEENISYRANRLDIDFDRFNRQLPIAYFTIQRKIDGTFSDNRYMTEAPLPTDVHIKLVEKFEADILALSK
jgi:hypothetical protein